METDPSPATHETTATPNSTAPSLPAATITAALPTEASPMDVDQPGSLPTHHSTTPPRGNCSPATAHTKDTPSSITAPKQTAPSKGTTPTPSRASQPTLTAHPPAHPWLLQLLQAAVLPRAFSLYPRSQPHPPSLTLPHKLPKPRPPMQSLRLRRALNPPSPNPSDNQQQILNSPWPLSQTQNSRNLFPRPINATTIWSSQIKAWGDLEAMAIQCLYLTEFLASIHQVDESAVLLPF